MHHSILPRDSNCNHTGRLPIKAVMYVVIEYDQQQLNAEGYVDLATPVAHFIS